MLAGLQLGQQLADALLNLGEFRNKRVTVYIVIFHDIASSWQAIADLRAVDLFVHSLGTAKRSVHATT